MSAQPADTTPDTGAAAPPWWPSDRDTGWRYESPTDEVAGRRSVATATPWYFGVVGAPRPARGIDRLARFAYEGRWDRVLELLEAGPRWLTPNRWKTTGTSLFTPLHQAAWHGAPVAVAEQLIELGAWRTIRTSDGRRPVDIALQRGHDHLRAILEPVVLRPVDESLVGRLDAHLAALVESRVPQKALPLRHPSCELLTEVPGARLWYPIAGMYGGFSIELRENHLLVESWSRVVMGSRETHVVTAEGAMLVDSDADEPLGLVVRHVTARG